MNTHLTLGAIALVTLGACQEGEDGVASPENDLCGASNHQALVGQPEAAVTAAGIAPGPKARVFGPNTALTMDFRAERINVELDEAGVVVRVYCG